MQNDKDLNPAPIMATLRMKQGRLYFPQWIRELTGFNDNQEFEVWITEQEGVILLRRITK